MSRKPTLLVDFDGVIHSYTSPWAGPTVIPDPPVDGAIGFLREATKHFHVCIYSSRSREPGGVEAMKNYLAAHAARDRGQAMSFIYELDYPVEKPAAFLTIDDRCFLFKGAFPDPQELLSFKPWNKL